MFKAITSEKFSVLWRSALVKLPRHVPTEVLRYTDPEGPFPEVFSLPSRGNYKIPLYIFIKGDLRTKEAASLPVIIDFHGGGFVLGSPLEQAPFCSRLARELSAVVISVDYRMGPVDKFPAALEDAEDVLSAVMNPGTPSGDALRHVIKKKIQKDWKIRRQEQEAVEIEDDPDMPLTQPEEINLDPTRIAVSGFSSGGNVALNLITSLKDPDWPSVFPADHPSPIPALLFYPSLDARQLPSERPLPSNMPTANKFWEFTGDVLAPSYLPRDQAGHLRASPGLAPVEDIHDQARMLLILPALDSLAAQSEVWVEKVTKSDRRDDLFVERYPNRAHGWTQFPDSWIDDEARKDKNDTYEKSISFIRDLWNDKPTSEAL